MLYNPSASSPIRVQETKDKDSKYLVPITYIPSAWAANTVYYHRGTDDYDVVVPTVFKGLYYKVTNPGKSGATEPTWPTTVGATVTDGATFEAVAYNLVPVGLTITTSTFTASDSVTLTLPTNTTTTTQVKVSAVPAGVESFTLPNHVTLSNAEELDFSLLIRVTDK